MPEKRLATVVLNWYWDERAKRWTVTARFPGGTAFRRVETTAPMGQVEANLVLDAVRREMESWLS